MPSCTLPLKYNVVIAHYICEQLGEYSIPATQSILGLASTKCAKLVAFEDEHKSGDKQWLGDKFESWQMKAPKSALRSIDVRPTAQACPQLLYSPIDGSSREVRAVEGEIPKDLSIR